MKNILSLKQFNTELESKKLGKKLRTKCLKVEILTLPQIQLPGACTEV